jgi:hypothetical protein
MTRAAKRALKTIGIPAVAWSDHHGQYYTRIGYRKSKSGVRQRAFFYLGTDENDAIAKAVRIKSEWRALKANRKRALPSFLSASDVVWPASGERGAASDAEMSAAFDETQRTPDADEVEQTPTLRNEQVRDDYLAYRKGKIGIGHGQGIDDKTYTNECRNLKSALASLDLAASIGTLGYAEIERLRDDIFRRVNDGDDSIGKRTANNYWNEVRRMLEWAHRTPTVPYRLPEDAADLFKSRFRNPNPVKIAQYDPKQLKELLKTATPRQRLYVYLGLNCGHYQADIGTLRRDEVTTYSGQPAILRRRTKTAHQNDFDALHMLWPETAALLKQEMEASARVATSDAAALALVSERGTPLYRKSPHCDIIGDTYLVLRKRSGVALPFKQFRKLGSTAIQRIGGDESRRLYKAGTIDSGDKVYVREAFEKLTPHLAAWGDELRRDGVLTLADGKSTTSPSTTTAKATSKSKASTASTAKASKRTTRNHKAAKRPQVSQ